MRLLERLRYDMIRYNTAPTIIEQHSARRELHLATIRDCIFVCKAEPEQESGNYHSDDGPNADPSCATDVHAVFEVLVFRGTDGLPFNLLKITENVSRASGVGPRSKFREDFLAETSRDKENKPQLEKCFNDIRTYPTSLSVRLFRRGEALFSSPLPPSPEEGLILRLISYGKAMTML